MFTGINTTHKPLYGNIKVCELFVFFNITTPNLGNSIVPSEYYDMVWRRRTMFKGLLGT